MKFGCLGVFIGLTIIAIAEMKISYQYIKIMRQGLIMQLNSGSETQYLLGKAGYAGLKGESQEVISILSPNLSKFIDRNEASQAYGLLGTAEFQLGHPQLAAGYFELMYANQPTSHNLYTLAIAYDKGGNLEQALEKYALVVSFQDQTSQSGEIFYAQKRIQEIMAIKSQ